MQSDVDLANVLADIIGRPSWMAVRRLRRSPGTRKGGTVDLYGSSRWQRTRRQHITAAAARAEPCGLCGKPIDYRIDGRHRDGPTVDHIVPTSLGGPMFDWGNLRPAHKSCNGRQGALLVNGRANRRGRQPLRTNRDW